MNFNFENKNYEGNFASENEIGNAPGFVYDIESGAPNLPDVPVFLNDIASILEYMCKDEILELRNKDSGEFNQHMEDKFPTFCDRYYALFQKILSGEDLSPLMNMLVAIEKVKSGKETLDQAEKKLGEQLAKKYVYPSLKKNQS